MTQPATSFRIQARDRALVRDLFLHRFATRDQLLSLGHFNSVPRCNNRMAQLVHARWVKRLDRVNGLGISQSLYAVGPAAFVWLPEILDLDSQEIAQQCRHGAEPMLIEHSLKALDFRLQISRDATFTDITVEEWRCELECRHSFQFRSAGSSRWHSVLVKPDGYVRIIRQGHVLHCFIEVDLGHVALQRFAKKLQAYRDYLDSGAFSEVYETDGFVVLTITVGERRLAHLTELKGLTNRHCLTTWRRLGEGGVFDGVWTTTDEKRSTIIDLAEGWK